MLAKSDHSGEKEGYHLQDTFSLFFFTPAVLGSKIYINVVFFHENRGRLAPCVTGLGLFH